MLDLSNSTKKSPWFAKDQAKARQATRFIGRGSSRSSTNAYRIAVGQHANCGRYSSTDIVFISAEGARSNRISPDFRELATAIAAHVTFITDGPTDRQRPYNCGEREVAQFLEANNYRETRPGCWEPKPG